MLPIEDTLLMSPIEDTLRVGIYAIDFRRAIIDNNPEGEQVCLATRFKREEQAIKINRRLYSPLRTLGFCLPGTDVDLEIGRGDTKVFVLG